MNNFLFILLLTPSVFWGQEPLKPPYLPDADFQFYAPKRTFVAVYTVPEFQTGKKGFQEWIKYELNDYKLIQKQIKQGDLKVSWQSGQFDIETKDSLVKNEILRVFNKMPAWDFNEGYWKSKFKADTVFFDKRNNVFYRFKLPENFSFRFKLDDSLYYQLESKSFPDTIELVGGRYGVLTRSESLLPIGCTDRRSD